MREAVRFYLGDELCTVGGFAPGLTLLDWLRETRGRTGTKEGCNEGDCGACTVLVVRPDAAGRLVWRPLNACIQLLGMMDGAQIFTVEDLCGADGVLHPVQAAMVTEHGSQCGFCTPGFVMAMAAYMRRQAGEMPTAPPADDARIDEALAGNLCRCTGYAPIVRAMKRAIDGDFGPDPLVSLEATIAGRLATLAEDGAAEIASAAGRFSVPADADALAHLLSANPQATLVAGATDVGLWITKGLRELPHVVAIGQVRDLETISVTPEGLRIGAAVTWEAARPALQTWRPGADEVLARLGAAQVRHAGTVCGNIANGSPIGDGPPLLIAAGAVLHLRSGSLRRSLPLEAFFIAYGRQDRQPGEFVEAVTVLAQPPGRLFRAYKISKRADQDISAVLGAFALDLAADGTIAQARLAFGGMAATPRRAAAAEAALLGRLWDRAALEDARAALAGDFAPISDMRAGAWYRQTVAANLLTRFFEETQGGARTRLSRQAPVAAGTEGAHA